MPLPSLPAQAGPAQHLGASLPTLATKHGHSHLIPSRLVLPHTQRKVPALSWAHGGGIWVFFLQGAQCQAQEPSPAPAAAWRSAPSHCCGHTRSGSAWGHRWTAAPGGTRAGPGGCRTCRTPRYCEVGSGLGLGMWVRKWGVLLVAAGCTPV